jgi:hypothetical protein
VLVATFFVPAAGVLDAISSFGRRRVIVSVERRPRGLPALNALTR